MWILIDIALVIRKMQVKAIIKCYFTHTRIAKLKT